MILNLMIGLICSVSMLQKKTKYIANEVDIHSFIQTEREAPLSAGVRLSIMVAAFKALIHSFILNSLLLVNKLKKEKKN